MFDLFKNVVVLGIFKHRELFGAVDVVEDFIDAFLNYLRA
jgi:hypothetical protein